MALVEKRAGSPYVAWSLTWNSKSGAFYQLGSAVASAHLRGPRQVTGGAEVVPRLARFLRLSMAELYWLPPNRLPEQLDMQSCFELV